jgi:bifunctional DNA-binding transcriptional regulator/antitoxin component of YhaV-PrlF toxin-antitoxin module
MLAKRTYKNQITIPKAVMEAFPDVEYFDVVKRPHAIILRPVETKPAGSRLAAIRAHIKALGLTEADVDAAIRWARRKTS